MTEGKYTEYMYGLIDRVMKGIGPRGSCSEQERELGRLFASEIEPACERVETETFTCSPDAFVGFFPHLAVTYFLAVALYFFIPAVSLALGLAAGVALFFEVVRYKELLDPLFGKKTGENVVGYVRPTGEVRRRVYVSAHFDSAYEFKLWYWFKGFSPVVMGLGAMTLLLLVGASLARTIVEPFGVPQTGVFWGLGIALIALSPVIALFAFFHTEDLVPGAMDDMAGIAVLAGLARHLTDARAGDGFYPENTEVVLLGLSSEEAGLRGAKRFAKEHAKEPDGVPSCAIFLDGIYDERYFTIFRRELWPGARLDKGLVDLALDSAAAVGAEAKIGLLPLGATDASAFALAGIRSVSMCLWDTSRLVPHYHTRHDTIDHIRPSSLTVVLDTTIEMLERLDAGRSGTFQVPGERLQ